MTSIICTIGPASNTPETIAELRKAGMTVCRMNFSHGSHEYASSILTNVRKSYDIFPGSEMAIALDTKGPEIRTGKNRTPDEVVYEAGSTVILSADPANKENGHPGLMFCDYPKLATTVRLGQLIYIADGNLILHVESIDANGTDVICKAQNTCSLGSKKNMNLPMCVIDLPAVSEQDKKDLEWGAQNNIDMVFASFIRRADDIHEMRKALGPRGAHVKIIAKIENFEGLHNFSSILEACDGVMVARGDLGMDLSPQKVFLAQKMMIARCNMAGKPVICATQMLESMIKNPRPTRAEVTDVANAVLDGADCVMCSGETANGLYPVPAVKIMADICSEAEHAVWNDKLFAELSKATVRPVHTTETVAAAAVTASFQQSIAAIIVLTTSGNSGRWVAKYRPRCPIICISRDQATARQLLLHRGCVPVYYKEPVLDSWQADVDARIRAAVAHGESLGFLSRDPAERQTAIVISGWKAQSGHTNTMRVVSIADLF